MEAKKNYFTENIGRISFHREKEWNNDDKKKFAVLLGAPSCVVRNWTSDDIKIDWHDTTNLTEDDDLMRDIDKSLSNLNIHNKEDIYGFCKWWFDNSAGGDYEQFQSFWNGKPCFDFSELNSDGKEAFTSCMTFAEDFRDIVGEGGLWAWDFSEIIRIIRMGFMKEWLSNEEVEELLYPMTDHVFEIFSSWKEFAISFICGGTYNEYKSYAFENGEFKEKSEFYDFCDKLCEVVQRLFSEDSNGEYWSMA